MWRIIDRGGESSAVELWISVPIVLMADNRELTVYRTNYMNPVLHRNCLLTKLPKYSHSELIFILWIFAVSFFSGFTKYECTGYGLCVRCRGRHQFHYIIPTPHRNKRQRNAGECCCLGMIRLVEISHSLPSVK